MLGLMKWNKIKLRWSKRILSSYCQSERKKILRPKPVYIEDLAKHDYFKDEAYKNISEKETAVNGKNDSENFSPS